MITAKKIVRCALAGIRDLEGCGGVLGESRPPDLSRYTAE